MSEEVSLKELRNLALIIDKVRQSQQTVNSYFTFKCQWICHLICDYTQICNIYCKLKPYWYQYLRILKNVNNILFFPTEILAMYWAGHFTYEK